MEFTSEQQKVISADGGLLVSASAGCGKTTVMLERVLRLLKSGAQLSRMLITTFTNAAAADMRAKLGSLLRAEYEKCGDAHMGLQCDYLPSADISTLHTWCLKTIKKYFYVTGDDPAFEVAGEGEAAVWRREAVERAIEEALQSETAAAVLETYTARRRTTKAYSIISDMLFFAEAQEDGDKWLKECSGFYGSPEAAAVLDGEEARLAAEAEALICAFEEAAGRGGCGGDKADTLAGALRQKVGGSDEKYAVARGLEANVKEAYDAAKEAAEELITFRQMRAGLRGGEARAAAAVFSDIALKAAEYYAAKKDEKGRMDFSDLERRAKAILLSQSGAEAAGAYDYIFIDEYQDINPLQESIIKLLGRGGAQMFFVGDIKQSIYSFRNCSPAAFSAKADELPAESVLRLNSNFRCRPGILRLCNEVFSRVMTRDFGGTDYASAARFNIGGEGNDGSVEFVSYKEDEKPHRDVADFTRVYSVRKAAERKNDEHTGNEAVCAAAKVLELLECEVTESGGRRKARYEDIAVLVRSRGGCAAELERVLRMAGVPVTASRELGITDSKYNQDLISYLRLINNRRDDIAAIGAMRSFFGRFTASELAGLRRAGGNAFFECAAEAAGKDTPAGRKARAFFDTLDGFYEMSKVLSVGELAGKITAYFDYFKYVLGKSGGNAHAEALSGLLVKMNGFGGELSEWLEHIESVRPPLDAPDAPCSVRIMTVHASKGLEFPFVVLCNLDRKFNISDIKDGMCDRALGLALESRSAALRRKFGTDVLEAAKIRKRTANKEEEMRILYVAMTRAKEKLVLLLPESAPYKNTAPRSASKFSQWLAPHADGWGLRPGSSPQPPPPAAAEAPDAVAAGAVRRAAEFPPLPAPVTAKATVTSLAKSAAEEFDVAEAPEGGTLLYPDYDGGKAGERAKKRGNAFHKALELYDYSQPESQVAGILAGIEDGDTVEADKLIKAVRTLRPLLDGKKYYREQSFIIKMKKGHQMLVQGVIDLMVMTGGGKAAIIDYKTGELTGEKMAVYKNQLELYAEAAERLLCVRVTDKLIYGIEEDVLIKV